MMKALATHNTPHLQNASRVHAWLDHQHTVCYASGKSVNEWCIKRKWMLLAAAGCVHAVTATCDNHVSDYLAHVPRPQKCKIRLSV